MGSYSRLELQSDASDFVKRVRKEHHSQANVGSRVLSYSFGISGIHFGNREIRNFTDGTLQPEQWRRVLKCGVNWLRDIYLQKHQFEPRVQELLFAEVEQHYKVPTAVTKNWLMINAGLFRESMRRVKTKAILVVLRSIRYYFTPLR